MRKTWFYKKVLLPAMVTLMRGIYVLMGPLMMKPQHEEVKTLLEKWDARKG